MTRRLDSMSYTPKRVQWRTPLPLPTLGMEVDKKIEEVTDSLLHMHVVSLYDFSGDAVRPWAQAGFECFAYDIQHTDWTTDSDGIHYVHADLYKDETWSTLVERHQGQTVIVFGFPVCTDMSLAGASVWERKRRDNPDFQKIAAQRARRCAEFAEQLHCRRWMVENPVGALSRLWRKPNFIFNPCDYGGHLSADDAHPRYPSVIPPRDAYRKRTCIWCGPDFVPPETRPVEPQVVHRTRPDGKRVCLSPMWVKLGGKTQRTKNIRSATPRGFATAVFRANGLAVSGM